MMLLHVAAPHLAQLSEVLALPADPAPQAPPGAEKITTVLGYVKWIAGAALVLGFFGGLVMFGGARIFDHHRVGKLGTMTMLASVGGAFLYAIGYSVLTTFAGS